MHPDPHVEECVHNSVEDAAFDGEKEKRRNPAAEEVPVERGMERAELQVFCIGNCRSDGKSRTTALVERRKMLDECLVEALVDDEVLPAKVAPVQDGRDDHIHFLLAHVVKEENHQVGKEGAKV